MNWLTLADKGKGEMNQSPAVHLQNVRFHWQSQNLVLDIPELEIRRGETVFVKGPSGSGKTTLLSVIGGILSPQSGSVGVLGKDLVTMSGPRRDHFRAQHLGIIFQMFNLLPYLSVLENVLLPCRFSTVRLQRASSEGESPDAAAIRLLTQLDLDADLIHRSVTDLSVGQQQRVAAARALLGSPELIIADEPTSALDTDRRARFLRLLLQECEKRDTTLIFVSHDSALQSHFQRSISLPEINHASREELGS